MRVDSLSAFCLRPLSSSLMRAHSADALSRSICRANEPLTLCYACGGQNGCARAQSRQPLDVPPERAERADGCGAEQPPQQRPQAEAETKRDRTAMNAARLK